MVDTENPLKLALEIKKRQGEVPIEASSQIVLALKVKYHVTNQELADLLDVCPSYISRVLNGSRNFTILHVAKLARYLDMPMAIFMWKTLKPPPVMSEAKKAVYRQVEDMLKSIFPDANGEL